MKAYIWRRLDQVSENYHPEGGLLIIARDFPAAMDVVADVPHIEVDRAADLVLPLDPDLVTLPQYLVFPDAGCC